MSSYEDMLGRLERETLKQDQLVSSLAGAANTNPDDFARQIELAKAARMSIDALPDYTEQAKQIKVLGSAGINRIWKDNPVVANWLTDETNAKVAYDQVKEIGMLESAVRHVGAFSNDMIGTYVGGGIEGLGYTMDAAWRRAVSGVSKLVLPTPEGGGTIDESSLAPTGLGEGMTYVGKKIGQTSEQYLKPSGPLSKSEQIAGGLGQATGQIGMMLIPGGQPIAAGLMFGQGAKAQKDKIDMDKLSLQAPQSDQDWEVLTGGAITGVTEFLASKLMIKTPQAFALRSKMLDFSAKVALGAGEEAIQEFSENTLQDLAHIAMTNPESTVKWNEAVESGEIGAWVGGIMQAVINSALHIKTRGQQQAFKNLNDVAGAQALRERSPDAFQNFADATAAHLAETTNGAVTDVYIDAQTFKQSLLDNGVNPESVAAAVPAIAEQYNAALETNGDIVIPMNEWVGRIAGTDVGNMLYQHARSTPESLSMAESDTAMAMAPEIQAQLEKFAASQLGEEEFKKSAKEVEGTLFQEIKSTGRYSDTAARVYSQLVRDFYVVQAAKMGINPLELYNEKPYKITNEGQTQAQPALSQETAQKLDESINWSQDRLDAAMSEYAYTMDDAKTKAMLTRMNPDQFLGLTTDADNLARIEKETGPLDLDELKNYSQNIKMVVKEMPDGSYRVVGHEGRHRMLALKQAGITDIPVAIEMGYDRGAQRTDMPSMKLLAQDFGGGLVGSSDTEVGQLIPINWNSYKRLKEMSNTGNLFFQRGVQIVGKPVPDSVDAVSNVVAAFNHAAGQTFKTNRDFKLDIQNRVLEAAKAAKVDLSEFTQSVEQYLVRVALADSMTALETNPNAVGWYNEKVTKALRLVSLIHPEINTDPQAKFAFTWALAVTSNGLKVDKNFELAERAYSYYKQNGKMPTDLDAGKAQIAINAGLDLYNELIEKHGFEKVENFMTTRQIVKEVEAFTNRNVSGENLTTEVYGAAALGPKIGNGFFANLYGHFEQLTMDRWLMRTWGRWTGTLVEENKANVKAKRTQLKALVQAMTAQQRKSFEKIIKQKLLIGKNESLDLVAKAINKASTSPANRAAMAQIGMESAEMQGVFEEILGPLKKNQKRVSIGDELRKVGNSLTGYLDGQKEAPSGPPERARIRKVMSQVLDQMQAQYPALTMSDLQALLWYPEKRLYDAAKTAEEGETSYEDDEAPDYANAAAALAKQLGVSQDLIDQTIAEVDDELQAAERARRAGRGAGDGILGQGAQQGVLNQAGRAEEVSLTEEEKALAEDIKSNGGVTLDRNGNAAVIDSGYVVAIRSQNVVGAESAVRALRDFVKENEALLNRENVVVGVFKFDDGSNRFSIDLNMVIPDRDAAVQIGTALDQIAIWDAANSTVIETGGKGGLGLDIAVADSLLSAIENGEYNVRLEELQARSQVNGGAVGQVQSAGSNGTSIASDRGPDQAVGGRSYGTATDGSVARLGYHFSREPRTTLDGRAHGTGLTAQERVRLAQADDARIKERIYFYVDNGNGIKPEAGVGANAHSVNLNNLYDIKADPLGLRAAAAAKGTDPDGVWFNAVESAIIDAGFDGYVSDTAQTNQGVAVLLGRHAVEVDQIQAPGYTQPAPRTEARGTPVFKKYLNQNDIFYSALQRAFEGVKQGSMPADQWIKWLSSNQPKLGVKKEEVEATGLREYLELNGKDKLTKEQIVEFLQNNGVRVEEVMRGDQDKYWNKVYDTLESGGAIAGYKWDDQNEDLLDNLDYRVEGVRDLMSAADYVVNRTSDTDAEYAQYQLPGGTKYKELLITLPGNKGEPYQSSHWEESNVLAHVRFNERTDADGKRVLFIEELQSDWAQQGRKRGFNAKPPAAETAAKEAYDAYVSTLKERYIEWYDKEFAGEISSQERRRELAASQADNMSARQLARGIDDIDTFNQLAFAVVEETGRNTRAEKKAKTGIPSAPFVKDTKAWVGLAIKRMIRYAADKGFDKVAFVNGKQSADRYNLAKQIESITHAKNEDGTYTIMATDINGRVALNDRRVQEANIENIVGKEVAQKIVSGEGKPFPKGSVSEGMKTLSGVDLEVGGEGMKSFYDKIVPQVANDVLKKLGGGKVETMNLGGEATEQSGFEITPAMRDAVLAGQALFQPSRGAFDPQRLTTILGEKADYSTFLHETAHFFLTMYADMAGAQNATPQMKADMQTILDWFGIKDLATWNAMSLDEQRKYHEQFAYNYEIYLFEGNAPSVKMQSLFDKFTAWLKRVYKSIRDELNAIYRQEHGEDLPILTGEVRDVMDRMLATDEQIKQAEKVRSMAPSFQTQEQAGVDDATWAAYQELAQEATNASLHDLATASLRQMKWLENARSRIIKDIQRSARETRRAMQEEVTKEVNAMPEFAAQAALREAKDDAEKAAILDTYGFKSQADLKAKLTETGKKADVIRKITDQRMLEEHSDFYDKSSIQVAIERALHNEARARFIAVELRMLSKAQTPVRVMQEAAKQAARSILMNRPIADLKEKAFVASEARAARQVMESIKRDDLPSAVNASRAQLLNNQLAAQTLAIKSDFAKSMELFKKLFRKDDKLAATRDINFISVARAILANYGLGRSENPPSFYLEKIKAYDSEFYAEIEPMITAHLQQAKPVTQLTVAEFQDLADQIKALWHLSGRLKKNDVDGKLVDRKEIVAELNAAIAPMLTGKERIGYDKAITDWQDTKMGLLGIRASLRRVESWVDAMDQGKADGPFRKYIWNPISEAVTQFRIAKVDYIKKYLDIMQAEEGRLDEGSINAPEIGYTFKNKAELLHAILHTGNESNKRKLLLGRNWGALNEETNTLDTGRWDRMIERMQKDGTLTKQDYDFAQKVWDLLEEMKPAAQKAHHQMYGFYFNEITANPVVTPFGTYRGGYVPAVSDSRLNTDQAVNNEKETEQGNNSYMFPTTGRGFTKGRVEYNKPLLLDLGFLPSHIDKVLRFTYIEPRVKEVGKLVKNREFGEMIDQLDPSIRKDMLMPWLQRTAMQAIQTPSKGEAGRRLDKIFSELRTRTGMQAMVGNFVNAIQQFTGFSIAALKVKPKYLKMATVMYIKDPKGTANAVSEASAYMRTRMNSQMFEMTKTIDQLLINPTKYDKLRQFAEKNGYFLQQGTQNIVDTIVWTGAYNESVESGMDQKDAVRAADAAVRQTQGSFSPEDVSRAESGSAFVRMFLMFYSYFNMQANLLGTEFGKVAREFGVRKGAGKMFYIYAMGFMIPAVMSELMVQAAGGFDDGDDDEYDWTDALRMFVGSQFRSAAAMIPGIGAAANAAVNMANKKPYDDRISTSPVVTNLEGALRAPVSLYQAIAEDESWKQATRDVLTMLGLITRLPLGQIAKPVGYAADVAQGKINPESPMDVARGIISGKDVNRKD